jgi:hypothetical protein
MSNCHLIFATLTGRCLRSCALVFEWKYYTKGLLFICIHSLFLSLSGLAQNVTLMSPLEIVVWDKTKREIQSCYLQISQAEASSFWKTYEQYERARRGLLKERSTLLQEYVEAGYSARSEDRINKISKRLLWNSVYYKKIYMEYYKRINDIIGPHRAIRFIGMEKYFQERLNARLDSLTFLANPIFAKRYLQQEH